MSTNELENSVTINGQSNTSGSKKAFKKLTSPLMFGVERKTLQTLQATTDEGRLTRPIDTPKAKILSSEMKSKEEKAKAKIGLPLSKAIHVFKDPSLSASSEGKSSPKHSPRVSTQSPEGSSCGCKCHDKTEEEKMIDYMTQEPSANDWHNLAEERKQALEETLVENRQLHFEVCDYKSQVASLTHDVKELREETRRLSEQRDYFANILQTLVSEDNAGDAASPEGGEGSADDTFGTVGDESAVFNDSDVNSSP